ncbi:MAG: haloacid dehalogenase type II [Deltaproteobacteria bacterium]|nr:haloacid dehalogenase type II [Deltaproteobacteria bacterium]
MVTWDTIRALTFDCYGTLIDWETGIVRDLRTGLGEVDLDDEALLVRYADAEAAIEAGPFVPYRQILREVLGRIARDLGIAPHSPDALSVGLGSWPPFPDTIESLRRLGERFRLCITSNVDRDLFAGTEERLGLRFDEVVTADQVRSYKPGTAHFEEARRRLALPPSAIAHVAQSLYHDVVPARRLGLATVWVDRRAGRPGGATLAPREAAIPDLRVESLAQLLEEIG